jgi:hypothetical protein
MSFGTLSDEAQILQIITTRGLTLGFVSALAQLAGIPRCSLPTLSGALNGGKGLRFDTSKPLLKLMQDLDAFATAFEPVQIDFTNAAAVHRWLKEFETGELRPTIGRNQDALLNGMLKAFEVSV